MFELAVRVLAAGATVFVAGVFGLLDFDFAVKVAAVVSALAFLGHRLELRGLRNAGAAGFFAVADAFAIALVLGAAGHLEHFGFLVILPCAWASARLGAQATSMAPLAASSLLVTHIALVGNQPGAALLGQAACVLGISLIPPKVRVETVLVAPDQTPIRQPDESLFIVRENYRKLRDAYRDLERKSRDNRWVLQLDPIRSLGGAKFFESLADRLREISGAETVGVYSVAQFDDTMVVRATAGTAPDAMRTCSLHVDVEKGPSKVLEVTKAALRAFHAPDQTFFNLILMDRGKVVGMVSASHRDAAVLERAEETLRAVCDPVARMILDVDLRASVERRLREAELLYEISSLMNGACTPVSLAGRLAADLFEVLEPDHLGFSILDEGQTITVAQQGANARLIESMKFRGGNGVEGWVAAGCPELVLFDARDDARCTPQDALRHRVGSYCLIPLKSGDQTFGFLTAASHRAGGIDVPQIETLRVVAAEATRAMERLSHKEFVPGGMMTPKEFQRHVEGTPGGFLVYLEPLQPDELTRAFGRPAFATALRKYGARLNATLPAGGAVCRRSQGDYVVLLPPMSDDNARSWANDAAATASLIGVTTAEGSANVPLAVRAKVAALGTRTSRLAAIEEEVPAQMRVS
jgi:GAF domain-containing protein